MDSRICAVTPLTEDGVAICKCIYITEQLKKMLDGGYHLTFTSDFSVTEEGVFTILSLGSLLFWEGPLKPPRLVLSGSFSGCCVLEPYKGTPIIVSTRIVNNFAAVVFIGELRTKLHFFSLFTSHIDCRFRDWRHLPGDTSFFPAF